MPIYAGSNKLNLAIGSIEIGKAYVGDNLVYQKNSRVINWYLYNDYQLQIGGVKKDKELLFRNTVDLDTEYTDCPFSTSAKTIVFGTTVAPTTCAFWFKDCLFLEQIDWAGLDTSQVKSMEEMFYDCTELTSLDLTGFDTSEVTNMRSMFNFCYALESLNLSNFKTSKVTNMSAMFQKCNSLTSLTFGDDFDVSNVTDMSMIFYDCYSLSELDLTTWNTSKVENMAQMFCECTELNRIFAGSSFITTNVTTSSLMFFKSTNLVGGAGTTYDSDHIDKTYAHIDCGTSNPGYFTAKDGLYFINEDGEVITELSVKQTSVCEIYTNEDCTFSISGVGFMLTRYSSDAKHVTIEGNSSTKAGNTGTLTATSKDSGKVITLNLIGIS